MNDFIESLSGAAGIFLVLCDTRTHTHAAALVCVWTCVVEQDRLRAQALDRVNTPAQATGSIEQLPIFWKGQVLARVEGGLLATALYSCSRVCVCKCVVEQGRLCVTEKYS